MDKQATNTIKPTEYLECERWWVFGLLMFVGGFFGGFSYAIRGGVFANAQTANFVLMALAAGRGDWRKAVYYLIPMCSYLVGIILSELMPVYIKTLRVRWATLFIFLEMLIVVPLALLPETAPFQISHVAITFLAAMQFNTFRQVQGIPMATTFCTAHMRMLGVSLGLGLRHKNHAHLKRAGAHFAMLLVFLCGAFAAAVATRYLLGKAMFIVLLPLVILAADLLYADLKTEKNKRGQFPHGYTEEE